MASAPDWPKSGLRLKFPSLIMPCDINCDLGENEPPKRREALFQTITSANIACGGHAGSVAIMALCVRLSRKHGVRLGAHPGLSGGFGREPRELKPGELELLLLQQVSALATLAAEEGMPLHHIKLHGALYHATEASIRWPANMCGR